MAITPDTTGNTPVTVGATSASVDITAAAVGAWVYCWCALSTATTTQTGTVTQASWTQVQQVQSSGATNGATYALFRRQKQSGDTTFSFSWTTSAKGIFAWQSYNGLDPVTPDEASAIAINDATARTAVPSPTATPTAANRWALACFGVRTTTAANKPISWTPDAATTERADVDNNTAASSPWLGVEIADSNSAVTQASHSYTATHNASESHDGSLIAFLVPAAAAAGDLPQVQPGPTWLDLFKPWVQRPRPPAEPSGPAGFIPNLSDLQFLPGPAWLARFKPGWHVPHPPMAEPAGPAAVNGTASFILAPLGFTANAGQSSPDVPAVQPGPLWLRLFRPWAPRPVPPLPARDQVTASGSLALAPVAFSGQGGQTAPDVPQAAPGPFWLRLFKPWVQKPVPPPPAVQGVNGTAAFSLAPVAFAGQGGQSSPDIPQAAPGPVWLRLFRPQAAKPVPPVPATPSVGGSASFTLAPLAFSGRGGQTAPDQPVVQPGPTWLDLFRPWVQKPRAYIESQPAAGVQCSGAFTLAPLAFQGQAGETSPDQPAVQPGPFWLRLFRPWVQRPLPPLAGVQPSLGPNATGSFALAPLAFTGQAGQSSPDVTQAQPGPLWLRLFRPWVRRPLPPAPAVQAVTSSGTLALAPLVLSAQAGQSAPDQPQASPGPSWLRFFRPWVNRPFPPPPATPAVNASGSLTLAPLALSGGGTVTGGGARDLPAILPGPSWTRLFRPWLPRPVPPLPSAPPPVVVPGPAPVFRIGQPRFQWETEVPASRWATGTPRT